MRTGINSYLAAIFVCFNLCLVNSSKILAVFPTPSISHQYVFRPLVQELLRRGHEVTVITTDPAFTKESCPLNLTEIDVHDLSYQIWRETFLKEKTGNQDHIFSQLEILMRSLSKIFEAQIGTKEVQDLINEKRGEFDLLLLEAYIRPAIGFTHIFKVPAIQVSSFGGMYYNYEVIGASMHPFLYPTPEVQRTYNLSISEKFQQLYGGWRIKKSFDIIEQEDDELLQKIFGYDIPSIRELSDNVDMQFLNIHSMWTDNRPVPPTVVYIGGIHNRPPKELPKNLASLLDSSKYGVIYFSLGTNVIPSDLPPNTLQMLIKVFSQLPYDVIWKWNLESMPGKAENIKLFKWLPQSDLLRHPKIKVFITQGGLQSTQEAIDAAVPLIGIPMLGDQWHNTEKYPYHKIGIKLDLASLTEEQFKDAIDTVISDTSYRENIKRLRTLMKEELQTPLERAVWWTEYVLKHGGAKHLRAAGANISWSKYLEIELVTIAVLVLFTALLLFFSSLYVLWRLISKLVYVETKTKLS